MRYIDLFSSDSVSLDKDKYISEIKKDMNELGYDTENLSFQAIPLSVDAMKKLRDQELNNGLLEKGKTNETNVRKMKLILSMPIRKIPGFQYSMN